MTSWACRACGFIGTNPYSTEWYAAHRDAHLEAFPELDPVSIDNLNLPIEWWERWVSRPTPQPEQEESA